MTETGPAVFRFDGSPFPFFIFQNCNWHVKMRLSSLWINTPKENTLSNVVTLLMFFFIDFLKIATLACPLVMLPHLQDTHHPRSRIKQHWFFFHHLDFKGQWKGNPLPWRIFLNGNAEMLCLLAGVTQRGSFVLVISGKHWLFYGKVKLCYN